MTFMCPKGDSLGLRSVERSHQAADDSRGGDRPPRLPPRSAASQPPDASLPVAQHRDQILYLVERHSVVILVGDTGTGKTTQVPQYLVDAGWAAGGRMVGVTQPRRAAAASVAARVAEERGVTLGTTVGYAVRFDAAVAPGTTQLKFVTDGVLLREMMDDPLLRQYSVLMLDEVHERSLATDMLLGLLRKVQARRPALRLIVSSATLAEAQLRAFFKPAPAPQEPLPPQPGVPASLEPAVIGIQGRTYPVEVHYLSTPCADYVVAAVEAVVDIHTADAPGDVLVFLTGQDEVEAAVALLRDQAERLARSSGYGLRLAPLPLYAGLPGAAQAAALAPAARGWRKAVIATNVAETSVTLPGVVYVVDCCWVKQRAYNPLLGLEALCMAPASKASAAQRAGRAGRVRAGKAFRLCTAEHFAALLPDAAVPEMQRSDLTAMVLQLKALGLDNILRFKWLSPPPAEALVRALEALGALGVLDHDGRLTPAVGVRLATLPVDPALGKALLAAFDADPERNCAVEMLTIVACLGAAPHGLFHMAGVAGGPRALDRAKARFAAAEGDLVTLLNVWRAWEESGRSSKWCSRHCLNPHALTKAAEVRAQLAMACARMGLPRPESCDGDVDILRRAIVAGQFMNAVVFERTDYNPRAPEADPGTHVYRLVRPTGGGIAGGGKAKDTSASTVRLRMHAGSVLARVRVEWAVFTSVQQTDTGWYEMQGVTALPGPSWLLDTAPHFYCSASASGRA